MKLIVTRNNKQYESALIIVKNTVRIISDAPVFAAWDNKTLNAFILKYGNEPTIKIEVAA